LYKTKPPSSHLVRSPIITNHGQFEEMIMGVTAAKTFRRRQGQVDQDAKAKPFYNIE